MAGPDDYGRPPRAPSRRGPLAAIVAVAVLVIALILIGQAIVHHNALQNCIDSGRRDCDSRVPP